MLNTTEKKARKACFGFAMNEKRTKTFINASVLIISITKRRYKNE